MANRSLIFLCLDSCLFKNIFYFYFIVELIYRREHRTYVSKSVTRYRYKGLQTSLIVVEIEVFYQIISKSVDYICLSNTTNTQVGLDMFISTLPQSKQRKCRVFPESLCRCVFWFYFSIAVMGHASSVVILTKPLLTPSALKRVVVGRGTTFIMFAVQILQNQSAKGNVI